MSTPQNCDVIKVARWNGVYAHYGVYDETPDGGHVIHYTGENEHSDFKGVVRETSFEEFLAGDENYLIRKFNKDKYPNVYSGEETVKRARSQIGRAGYNLAFNNCEHFAVWCKTDRSNSSQTEILDVASIPELNTRNWKYHQCRNSRRSDRSDRLGSSN